MAFGFLTPDARLRVFSDLGVVLPGALLNAYVAGSLAARQNTYTDSALTVPNANPVVASAGGLFGPIFLTPGQSYQFQLTTAAGVVVWTQDNVAIPGSSVALGGTGAASFTAHGVLIGEGTAAIASTSAGTTGQLLTSRGAALDPTFQTPVAVQLVQTTTLVGAQNDVVLTASVTELRLNNATLVTISGFAAGIDGQRVALISIGAGQVDLLPQSALSVAANRLINFATVGTTSLSAGSGTALIEYDATTARWRLIAHEQGAWITPAYLAANFTANAGTWTVDSGDVTTYQYVLRGRTLTLAFYLDTTTTSGGMGADLRVAIPAGLIAAKTSQNPIQTGDNNASAIGLGVAGVALAFITLRLVNAAAWASTITNLTYVHGQITIEVQ